MYQAEDLTIYPYFENLLQDVPLSTVLDSLTGVVSRGYVLSFLHWLIDEKKEFTVGMIDLDNFKSYNDNYGHSVGDKVLTTVADSLIEYAGSLGVVGRFGGDEFILISFIGNDYHRVHDFYENMYNQGGAYAQNCVFRRDINVDHLKLFISATVGSASFPKDAQDFDTLFSLIDKTLYRGKFKGRNCYIIYLPQKHAHLEIPKLARHSLYDTFAAMAREFDGAERLHDRVWNAFQIIRNNIHLQFLFYIDGENQVRDMEKDEVIGTCEDLTPLVSEGFFACSGREDYQDYVQLIELMKPYGIHSMILQPIGTPEEHKGLLLFSPEPHTLHIWQDEEFAAAFMLARMMKTL